MQVEIAMRDLKVKGKTILEGNGGSIRNIFVIGSLVNLSFWSSFYYCNTTVREEKTTNIIVFMMPL